MPTSALATSHSELRMEVDLAKLLRIERIEKVSTREEKRNTKKRRRLKDGTKRQLVQQCGVVSADTAKKLDQQPRSARQVEKQSNDVRDQPRCATIRVVILCRRTAEAPEPEPG